MIVTHLIGGLGNQLFQYAAGRALSLRLNAELSLDISDFKDYKVHNGYHLGVFNIRASTYTDRRGLPTLSTDTSIRDVFKRHLLRKQLLIQNEKHFQFDPDFLTFGNRTYLKGYWQSARYFARYANQIRNDLEFKNEPDLIVTNWLNQIQSTRSVALHIRRGDYVSNPSAAAVHGILSLDYYRRAADELKSRIGDVTYFVFTDDPTWADENLSFLTNKLIVTGNEGPRSHEDLRLMASCEHLIIANSTFSWWGAWLCKNPEKIVIAPNRWFLDKSHNTKDIYQPEWVQIPC